MAVARNELLACLDGQPVDDRMEQIWVPLAGSLEQNIASFINGGLLTEAGIDEKLDKKFRVADLKPLLESRDIKVKGKKTDMIKALQEKLTPEEASGMVADIRLYHLTHEGKNKVAAYMDEKKRTKESMEARAMALLMNGDVKGAGEIIARYESQQLFPRGTGINWSSGMPEPYLKEAEFLVKYPYDDLPMIERQRKEVGACLALSVMMGESASDAAKRLMSIPNSEFSWSVLEDTLNSNPCCSDVSALNDGQPKALVELYALTRLVQARNSMELTSLSNAKIGKGVRLLSAKGHNCKSCCTGKNEYAWSEIKDIPKLPRRWGCMCTYIAWL
ncbi:MAG: SAP domain-containing protein [Caulobacteraceae bacterium]